MTAITEKTVDQEACSKASCGEPTAHKVASKGHLERFTPCAKCRLSIHVNVTGDPQFEGVYISYLCRHVFHPQCLSNNCNATARKAANRRLAVRVGGIVAGIALAPLLAPVLLGAFGWTAGGVAAGSAAAGIQAGIGNVAAGSAFAVAQSVGAGGALPFVGFLGGGAGAGAIGEGARRVLGKRGRDETVERAGVRIPLDCPACAAATPRL